MGFAVYKLSEVDINSNFVGGKARNLAILAQNGFPVPEGFVISLEASQNNIL